MFFRGNDSLPSPTFLDYCSRAGTNLDPLNSSISCQSTPRPSITVGLMQELVQDQGSVAGKHDSMIDRQQEKGPP